MRFALAGAAMVVAIVCSIGWIVQMRAGAGVAVEMMYAAGAGVMIGLAIWAIRYQPPRA